MGHWIVKVNDYRGQYRITIPKELARKKRLRGVEVLKLTEGKNGQIILEEYHGKGKKGE